MVKTQNSFVLDDRFDEFSVPSFRDFIDDDLDELALYPVKVVQFYLKKTRQFRTNCKCLLISTGQNNEHCLLAS